MRKISTLPNAECTVTFKSSGIRVKEQVFKFSDFRVKGVKAGGVLITKKEIASIRIKPVKLEETDVPKDEEPSNDEPVAEKDEVKDDAEGPGLFD